MAFVEYQRYEPKPETARIIVILNKIIDTYTAAGYKLSVRQLYYQLVARDVIENTEASYRRIAGICNDARMGGLMDWDAIEDRNREIDIRSRWTSGKSLLSGAARGFHMDHWDNQEHRLYVVVEKAALEGVLGNLCIQYDVPLLAARGYPSVSIVREMVEEHIQPAIENGQMVTVLHLGDHDPSGIDMTRDLEERFCTFITGAPYDEDDYPDGFYLQRIALSMAQIEELKPPPNAAKLTDSRCGPYIRRFGNKSWELDALKPEYIHALVERHIKNFIDPEKWEEKHDEIEGIRAKLNKIRDNFKD